MFQREVLGRCQKGNAGAVDGDIDAAECRNNISDRCLDRRRIRDIADEGFCPAAETRSLRSRGILVDIENGDLCALEGEGGGNRSTDPGCAAGDQRHLAGQRKVQVDLGSSVGHGVKPRL